MMTGKNIVLNVPHSSINGIFDDNIGKWPDNPYFINECVRKHTDWWTDMLFTVRGEENVTKVVSRTRDSCAMQGDWRMMAWRRMGRA